MILTSDYIRTLPTGVVLKREGKSKLRIVYPSRHRKCQLCYSFVDGAMCRWEKGGNINIISMCPECTVIELNGESND